MATKHFKTALTYELEQVYSSPKPSRTVPDQSLSIPEILRRFASGQSLSIGNQNLTYSGDTLVPELRGMDPVDLDHWKNINDEAIHQMENELKELKKNEDKILKEKQEQEAARQQALDKLLASDPPKGKES